MAEVEKVPNHQALDLMMIMPHVKATGLLVHTPITHGHFINVVATPKKSVSKEAAIKIFKNHPRIRVVKIADGFNTNTSFFHTPATSGTSAPTCTRSASGRDCIGMSGDDLMFAINIPRRR